MAFYIHNEYFFFKLRSCTYSLNFIVLTTFIVIKLQATSTFCPPPKGWPPVNRTPPPPSPKKNKSLSEYRIYPCRMRTFFSQILTPKSRCALYTEHSVFMLGNLHNNTKSAKSNSFQFYAASRNKSRQKACLALYITSIYVRQGISHATCLRLKICCIFLSISMTK